MNVSLGPLLDPIAAVFRAESWFDGGVLERSDVWGEVWTFTGVIRIPHRLAANEDAALRHAWDAWQRMRAGVRDLGWRLAETPAFEIGGEMRHHYDGRPSDPGWEAKYKFELRAPRGPS